MTHSLSAAVESAKERYGSEDVEFDSAPAISEGQVGYWVAAWVFVPKEKETYRNER